MRRPVARVALAAVGALVSGACVAQAAQGCAALAAPGLFRNVAVEKAVEVPADATNKLPAFCEVTAILSPVPGSRITAVYRLPENWNGRMLGLGGGGWAGNLQLLPPRPGVLTASVGLARGYATAQTDGGHFSGTSQAAAFETAWMRGNPVAVTDFSHRAIHETAVLGKQIVARHYGRPATRNYFQGCSTGGRMGMMQTQRYPEDYDGVIAGAPVYSLLVQSSTLIRDRIFRGPGAIPAPLIARVNQAVLAACDAADGLKDGVVTDPQRCNWDPAELQCKAGAEPGSCLAQGQVQALREAYRTVRTRSGVVGNYGLTRGGEGGWERFVPTTAETPRTAVSGALGDLIPLMFGRADFDTDKFDIEQHQAAVHRTPFAAEYEASSTNLSRFFRRGGKLILWHGMDDPGPSYLATADYFKKAVKRNGGENLRFFALPGVYHCALGPGADDFDALTALEQWVEQGKAPENMVAKSRQSGFERPVCAWPKLPYYQGGDPNQAGSFACK